MLEVPEAYVQARQLNETVMHRTIRRVTVNGHPHKLCFYWGDSAQYPDLLTEQTLTAAAAHGGMIELALGSLRLVFNDGANLRWSAADVQPPAKHQLLLDLDDGSWLSASVLMYGGIWAFEEGTVDNPYYQAALEKPSPLTPAFDESYFAGLVGQNANRRLSAKAFLATEQRIPGVGNGVLQDILFRARVHPRSSIQRLGDAELEQLFRSVKETLRQMTEQGGRDTEKDLYGRRGGYATLLSSKTYTDPCPVCGGTVRKEPYLGGSIYSCLSCQVAAV
ncbi:endonuclease VIII [Gorillibacterium sp. CAU 1737]|uniref:endonuclease VIII n=1 Tax=Gorillibacterium sp. CAU 1737 TaxID=3140362 RepID=UPI003260594F